MAPVPSEVVPSRYDASLDDLAELLAGQPAFRARQVWAGLYERGVGPEAMTDLPATLREQLSTALPPALTRAAESVGDGGDTVKWL